MESVCCGRARKILDDNAVAEGSNMARTRIWSGAQLVCEAPLSSRQARQTFRCSRTRTAGCTFFNVLVRMHSGCGGQGLSNNSLSPVSGVQGLGNTLVERADRTVIGVSLRHRELKTRCCGKPRSALHCVRGGILRLGADFERMGVTQHFDLLLRLHRSSLFCICNKTPRTFLMAKSLLTQRKAQSAASQQGTASHLQNR